MKLLARSFRAVGIIAVLSIAAFHAAAQQDTQSSPITAPTPASNAARPYGPGEKLVYDLAVGGAKVGTGTMSLFPGEQIDGHDTYHSVFDIKGGFLFFKVNDRLESWFDDYVDPRRDGIDKGVTGCGQIDRAERAPEHVAFAADHTQSTDWDLWLAKKTA